MRRAAAALLALPFLAACASSPKEEAAKDREKSREQIQAMVTQVIAAMRENRPEVYFEHLCRAQRASYPLEEMRADWTEYRTILDRYCEGMTVKSVAVDENNPGIATALVFAPNHPRKDLMFEAIREDGEWRIREARFW